MKDEKYDDEMLLCEITEVTAYGFRTYRDTCPGGQCPMCFIKDHAPSGHGEQLMMSQIFPRRAPGTKHFKVD
jgi:hypothetical protein